MDDLLREELIHNLTELVGEVYLLELALDHPPEAGYCSPQVFRALCNKLDDFVQQHTGEITWMVHSLAAAATPPA